MELTESKCNVWVLKWNVGLSIREWVILGHFIMQFERKMLIKMKPKFRSCTFGLNNERCLADLCLTKQG